MWGGSSPAYPNGFPWMDPRNALSDKYTVIAMDQRNAGRSVADVKPDHGWHTFAADHLALMDHLGFKKFHVMGGCIGGSYCFEAIEQAPDRVPAAVLQNPIGLWENRENWDAAVKGYGETVRKRDPSISQDTIDSFGKNMFGSDFVFSVTRDFVKACRTPLYLQPGTDKPHPAHTSAEIAELAPTSKSRRIGAGRSSCRTRSGACMHSSPSIRPDHDAPSCSCGGSRRRLRQRVLGTATDLGCGRQ